jgi:hypothetical protein
MKAWPAFVLFALLSGLAVFLLGSHEDQFLGISALLALTIVLLILNCGLWDCRTIFFVVSSIYVLAGPADIALIEEPSALDADASFTALRLGYLFLLASSFTMLTPPDPTHTPRSSMRLPVSWAAAALLAVVAFSLYVLGVALGPGFRIGELSRAEVGLAQAWHLSLLRFGLHVLILYLAIAAGERFSETLRRAPVATAVLLSTVLAFCAVELLVLGDRRMLVTTAIGVAVAVSGRRMKISHILLGGFAGVLLLGYSLVRNQPVDRWVEIVLSVEASSLLAPRNLEFGAFALVASTLLTDFVPNEFPTYLQALPQLVPAFFDAARPEAPSQWFVRTYFPEVSAEGGAFAFNFVIEAYLNAGLFGVLAVALMVGALLRYCSIGPFREVLNPLAAASFAFVMRLDLASLLRNVTISGIALIGFYALFRLLQARDNR